MLAHREQRREHGHEAECVDEEADADSGSCDEHAGERGADHTGGIEDAGVEGNSVRELARADHLEGERLPSGSIEHECESTERREREYDGQCRGAGQRDRCESCRDDHRSDLRPDDEAARVQSIDDGACEQPEERVRREAAEQEHRDRER